MLELRDCPCSGSILGYRCGCTGCLSCNRFRVGSRSRIRSLLAKLKKDEQRGAIEEGKQHRMRQDRARIGERRTNSQGYVLVYDGRHWPIEHRKVAEKKIGRLLMHGEIVHHVDLDRANNSIDNLFVCENTSHHSEVHASLMLVVSSLVKSGAIAFRNGSYALR